MAILGFGEVAEQLRRSTVVIHAGGSGSGIIWSTEGIIVTNAHVARGSQLGVQLWDGRELKARIMSRNPRRDIALLRVNATTCPRPLRLIHLRSVPANWPLPSETRLASSERSRPEQFTQ